MISDLEKDATDTDHKSVGHILSDARKKQKKEIATVSNKLCIRKTYLEALENNETNTLPGRAYTIGFLRNYASYLKLDVEKLVEQYQREYPAPIITPSSPVDDTVPLYQNMNYIFKKYLFLGLILVLIGLALYGIISLFSSSEDKDLTVPLSEETIMGIEPLIPEQISLGNQEESDSVMSEDKKTAESVVVNSTQQADVLIPVEKPVATMTSSPILPKDAKKITLFAEQDSWVELVNLETGYLVFSRILKAGESYELTGNRSISLTTGNAGGLKVFVGDMAVPQLGPVGVRRSFIRMDPQLLRDGNTYKKDKE